MPPQSRQPQAPQGPSSFLQAVRDPGRSLKSKFKGRPIELAARFGLSFPEKPAVKMQRLGIYDEDYFGPITPGLRDLITDTCSIEITDAVVIGPRGGGKLCWIETPVPTASGWKTMGSLKVGDTLYDRDGAPCKVTRLYPVYRNKTCYRMIFSDGSSVVCSGSHPWITQTQLERGANLVRARRERAGELLGDWRSQWQGKREATRTTDEIRRTLRTGARGDANHSIDNTAPVRFPRRFLPIDPYVLGLWLGDGSSRYGEISVWREDVDEVQRRLEKQGYEVVRVPDTNGNYRLRPQGLTQQLRELGLLQNKHVPVDYLRSSILQRRWLLAGLMDSDGTVRNYNNNCQFDNMNERLSDAVYELVVSLGWKATRSKKTATLYGVEHGICHRVSFRPTRKPFRLRRKRKLLRLDVAQETRHLRRMIVDIQPCPTVPVRCIEVDSPSHTYLLGEQMVPTHNSQGVSFIEFYLWMIEDFDALNFGGSEQQATNVYTYLTTYIESDPYWGSLIKGETKQSETETVEKAWIKVLTASSKSVRSPHAGGWKMVRGERVARGGLLVIDEEAEAEPDLVMTVLPTINTALPSVNVRSSTFHNAEGTFAEVVDNHVAMGYKKYDWTVFDVCSGCSCSGGPRDCQSPEPCFRDDHYEDYTDPDTGETERRLVHKAYCGGLAKYASGWVPMTEIEASWRRWKRNHAKFEVEMMGSRPGSSGFVIKDRLKWASNRTDRSPESLYLPGSPITICVDWGTVAAGLCVWQEQPGDKHVLLHADLVEEAGTTEIFGRIFGYWNRYIESVSEVAADIGGGGNYNNPSLREEYRLPVRDVNFAEEKEAGAAAWNIYNEAAKLIIPEEHEDFLDQVKNWKRKNGRIQKGNDHLCDATLCYFAKFIDRLGLTNVRVLPRTFHSQSEDRSRPPSEMAVATGRDRATGRAAMARGLGSRRRK
jgi:hypothetical protein